MSPKNHMSLAVILLAVSVALEMSWLAGIFVVGDGAYHLFHILLMATLAVSQLAVYFHGRRNGVTHRLALWVAIGTGLTAIGDFVNGAASGVEPVSLKLSWALLWFGTGYALYCWAMWQHNNPLLKAKGGMVADYRYLLAVPVLAINVVSWFQHVEANVAVSGLLYYGSFLFNATLYVMLPTFAIWFYYNTGRSVGGLLVMIGALLIPYSDLVLFGSWLRGGDPAVPGFQLYAYNWILYFGGQVLFSLFPALVIEADARRSATGHANR